MLTSAFLHRLQPYNRSLIADCRSCCMLQTNKAVDKLFTSNKPSEPVEPAFVTDAKLKWNVRLAAAGFTNCCAGMMGVARELLALS